MFYVLKISLFDALPLLLFFVPVWVRTAKLIVGQNRELGELLYFSSFVVFFSLVTIAGMSTISQAIGLFSISTSLNLIWFLGAGLHLSPLSSYKLGKRVLFFCW
jgi:hypothetical protein